ncbi:hypothetical protein QIH96_05320 [Bradyrhizobium japonicum]|uniref:hypothetical protein n=1 Tax=Bradyrhizobium japonicum TaxID=375 RepID=UPI00271482EF|nr:hypothetical protein [Bradyrhizobium japonicum]WLB64666.1 hypothetical protein QIH96_05320 [Bradyrhizobium japonicum]
MPRNVKKGDLVYGGVASEPAQLHMRKDAIRKGTFLTSTQRTSDLKLAREFPEMAEMLQSAGPVPSAASLAKYWAEQAALQEKIDHFKATIAKVKRK